MFHSPAGQWVDPFVVNGRCAFGPQLPVQNRSDAAVSIGRPRRHQLGDQRQDRRVLGFAIASPRPQGTGQAGMQIGAGNAQNLRHGGHRMPPDGRDCACQVSFF
jgi:hypothetical protein